MITYREMTHFDIGAAHSLEVAIYPESPWSVAQFKEEIGAGESRKYIVALSQENNRSQLIGYGGVAVVDGVADIHTLTVAPAYRRKGTGSAMLTQIEEWAISKGVLRFMLEVREGNTGAFELYANRGYNLISRRDNYYGRNLHALIMEKVLPPV